MPFLVNPHAGKRTDNPQTETSMVGWAVAHSKDNFRDPDKFDPERWLEGAGNGKYANDKLDASQPFSFGPRNCIGKK